MVVKIAHASIDERGKAAGGNAGDQTSKEVCTRNWWDDGWNIVLRPKTSNIAKAIAKAAEDGAKNPCIGYDQGQRTTLFTQAQKVGFNLSKIKVKCETDCSAYVAVCVNAAGVSVSKNIYTGNQAAVLKATGKFTILTDKKYLREDKNLKIGDILLCEGKHTAIVISNGSSVNTKKANATTSKENKKTVEVAHYRKDSYAGTYKANKDCYLRVGAGKKKDSIVKIPKGTLVDNYGYYNVSKKDDKWLYVTLKIGSKSYLGYCIKKYMDKVK